METLIKSLSAFTLEFLYMTRNNLTRIASYLRKAMTKLCIKILVESDSAIESAFPYVYAAVLRSFDSAAVIQIIVSLPYSFFLRSG